MTRVFFACIAVSMCASAASARDPELASRPIADAVLAIYPEAGEMVRKREPTIILAVWPDEHVVWSGDRLNGGAPYHEGQVDPNKVATLLARFEEDGLFDDDALNDPHFGPDSGYTTLLIKSGKKQVKMQSWHESYEAAGKVVARSTGLQPLNGRRRLDVLREEPADYLHFRFVWSETRGKLTDLIPDDGKPSAGKPIMKKKGGVYWQESPPEPAPKGKTDSRKR